MINDPPLDDEDFIMAATSALAEVFEARQGAGKGPVFTEDIGCSSELETTIDDDENEATVLSNFPSDNTVLAQERKQFDYQSLTTLPEIPNTQPNVVIENSEEETDRSRRRQQRQSSRLKASKTRKERKEIYQAVDATLATFDNRVSNRKTTTKDKLVESWKNMYRISFTWLCKLYRKEELRKSAFHKFLLNGVNALRKTMNAARPRSPEVHDITLRFIVDFHKIYEISKLRGMNEVLGTIGRLVESVLGLYLSSSKKMNPTNLSWIQTKQVMKLLMSITMSADSAYGLLQLLSKIQMYFISKWAVRRNRNEEFIAYAVSQIQFFSNILTGRLESFAYQKKYCIQF